MGALVQLDRGRVAQVLLLENTGDWILVLEDKVHLVGGAALVGPEHDGVGAAGVERLLVQLRLLQQFHVCAVASETIRRADFILKHEVFGADVQEAGEGVEDGVALAGA